MRCRWSSRVIRWLVASLVATALASTSGIVFAAEAENSRGCARSIEALNGTIERDKDKRIFWGDLHTHTAFSMDAYVLNTTQTPEDAYVFARGGPSKLHTGGTHQLKRPLDFAAVTDHAEYFGLSQVCLDEPQRPYCKELAEAASENSTRGFVKMFLPLIVSGSRNCLVGDAQCRVAERTMWQRSIDAANAANVPCEFTAFVASEWTASPNNLHWHRNLIYANDTVPERAINSFDQPTQERLWEGLDAQCKKKNGCEVLAIPHNSNIGMGGAFRTTGYGASTHALRARFEKLVEIHQHKGSSECYSQSNFSDEACDFEFMMPIPLRNELRAAPRELAAAEHAAIASGYVRDTIAKGLALRANTGVNPFRYGFVGATDSHSGRPGDVQEDHWAGSLGQWDQLSEQRERFAIYNPGGITGVWAQENTRASLFAALKRREVFATSGPRIALEFEQSFEPNQDCALPGKQAVRMGGTVETSNNRWWKGKKRVQQVPTFTVRALKDAAALQRIDIVKLALVDGSGSDADSEALEGRVEQTVYSVAGGRTGRADWCLAWKDKTYQSDQPALWYARVLQVPTKRWDGKNMIRERAWSSPIWSLPVSHLGR